MSLVHSGLLWLDYHVVIKVVINFFIKLHRRTSLIHSGSLWLNYHIVIKFITKFIIKLHRRTSLIHSALLWPNYQIIIKFIIKFIIKLHRRTSLIRRGSGLPPDRSMCARSDSPTAPTPQSTPSLAVRARTIVMAYNSYGLWPIVKAYCYGLWPIVMAYG